MILNIKPTGCSFVLLIVVCLSLAACGGGQEQTSMPAVANSEPLSELSSPDLTPSPPIHRIMAFPTHDEPLPTDWGDFGWRFSGHIMVELMLKNGCLRALGEMGFSNGPIPSFLLVWPDGFTWREEGGAIRISDRTGVFVAQVGDMVRFSGRLIELDSDLAREIEDAIPAKCVGPYYMVGDEVSSIGLDEPEVLSIQGTTLYFQRLKTRMLSSNMVDSLELFSGPVDLELEGDCLLVPGEINPSERHMVVWPQGFYPHIGEDGIVEVRNGGGRTVARVGDGLYMRGREAPARDIHIRRCGVATLWRVDNLRNANFPLVFLQHEEERDTSGRVRSDFIEGKLTVMNGCTFVREAILVWPSDFTVRGEPGSIKIIDENGEVLVHENENVLLKSRILKPDDDPGRQIQRTLPSDCIADSIALVVE